MTQVCPEYFRAVLDWYLQGARCLQNTHPQLGSTWKTWRSCSRLLWLVCSAAKVIEPLKTLCDSLKKRRELYLVSWLDETECSLCTEVCCFDDVSFPPCDRVVLRIPRRQVRDKHTTHSVFQEWRRTLVAPTTKLWATFEMKPSTCTPRSL